CPTSGKHRYHQPRTLNQATTQGGGTSIDQELNRYIRSRPFRFPTPDSQFPACQSLVTRLISARLVTPCEAFINAD
ncbi:hypothetical protein EIP99_00060, partial [Xanthomonas campestris pv. raphani]